MAVETSHDGPAATRGRSFEAEPVVIEAQGVSKSFRLPVNKINSLKERITTFSQSDYKELRALRDVSFEVHRGSSSASSAATAPARAPC